MDTEKAPKAFRTISEVSEIIGIQPYVIRFWESQFRQPRCFPQQCLEREIQEELGVSSTAGDVFLESVFEYDHGKFKIIAMYTDLHSKGFTLSSHDKAEWVPTTELLNYKLLPEDIPIAFKSEAEPISPPSGITRPPPKVTLELKVAAPEADISRVNAVIPEPPSFP